MIFALEKKRKRERERKVKNDLLLIIKIFLLKNILLNYKFKYLN